MIKTFVTVGWLETISYLSLLLIAMPLKYIWDIEEAVKYNGWVHGVLFVTYIVLLLIVGIKLKWKLNLYVFGFIAALLPLGPIVFDRKYLK